MNQRQQATRFGNAAFSVRDGIATCTTPVLCDYLTATRTDAPSTDLRLWRAWIHDELGERDADAFARWRSAGGEPHEHFGVEGV